jgi:diguanylate cyclase (GGDEF) domain
MKKGRGNRPTIGIMLGDVESDYTVELVRGFYSCAREENVNIVFLLGPQIPQYCADILAYNLDGDYNYQFDTIYDYVHYMQFDVLIIATGSLSYYYHNYDKKAFLESHAKVPYILIQDTSDTEKVPYLISDNYVGMRSCMEHLVKDHGYKKIAFLSGPKVNIEAQERLRAYLDVMQENGCMVDEKMIAYGNFTELVETHVRRLLDENPDLEAIACANDNMAKGCYKVCKERHMVVGRDIAITGYDDVDLAKKMQPPLTSVSQRSFHFSYTALRKAIALYKGEQVGSEKAKTLLVKRGSCGCHIGDLQNGGLSAQTDLDAYIEKSVKNLESILFSGLPYKKDKEHFCALLERYFAYISKHVLKETSEDFVMDDLLGILQEFVGYPHISRQGLLMHVTEVVQVLAANVTDSKAKELLLYIISATQQFIYNSINKTMEKEMLELNRKAWFVPSFTRDLNRKGSRGDLREVMRPVLERFRMMKVKSCYVYLFAKPVVHDEQALFRLPEKMYLAAYYTPEKMACYSSEVSPYITAKNGFTSFLPEAADPAILTSFILFSGDKQYGILLCDVEQEDMSFLQICGMQLGALFRYLDLNWVEQESYQELQKSLKVISEKNNILSFISEYDELSGLLNRRGFMERILTCLEQNDGRKAYLIFCDLDHLKEINDSFGHTAGDFAIESAAKRLKQVLPKDAITARIGGDEFVSLVLSDLPGFKDALLLQLEQAAERFNSNGQIPYYVEISTGIWEFYCEPQTDINELMNKSDELLYEAKKNRRRTICK